LLLGPYVIGFIAIKIKVITVGYNKTVTEEFTIKSRSFFHLRVREKNSRERADRAGKNKIQQLRGRKK